MSSYLLSQSAVLLRVIQALGLFLVLMACSPASPRGGEPREPRIVALHGLEAAEVRQQGFTLPKAAKVHIYARGAGVRPLGPHAGDTPPFAYGWILNAVTREVVWQMDGRNTTRDWEYRIADRYLDLPAGSYEAYFANHGFGQSLLFAQWTRNIDRRNLVPQGTGRSHGFLAAIGADEASLLRHWREQVGNYGMEIYLPGGDPKDIALFEAPLRWRNTVVALAADHDNGQWTQAFRLSRPAGVHVYAEGEGSGHQMHDHGWILEARTRKVVWSMTMEKSSFAGGAPKNRRQVETVQLPAGDYEATFITDGSHSPADWNAAPPADPHLYGLTLAIPSDGDLPAFSTARPLAWKVLAELVRVGNDQDRNAPLVLESGQSIRVLALGEGNGKGLADVAWIEDAGGKKVWTMDYARTRHAGGAPKNRMIDELVSLPKGRYTLRFRTDDSHAYGDWNSDPPAEADRYGITVYALREGAGPG